MIDILQTEFGIPGAVEVIGGTNGMPKIVLTHASGARAEVYLHGGHITSWTANGEELLFMSSESDFEPGQAIRGGIPVIFPQFGGGPLPKHGVARTQEWKIVRSASHPSGSIEVILQLTENEQTLAMWPHRFTLTLGLMLGTDALTVEMRATNTGNTAFDFQAVLHTYFKVADIGRTEVRGLEGVTFIDSLRGNSREVETRPVIRFAAETDRIYVNTPDRLYVCDEGNARTISIETRDMPDVVVWNPWIEKSQTLSDFGDDEYLRMVCVETGSIESRPKLSPGDSWRGSTIFSCGG